MLFILGDVIGKTEGWNHQLHPQRGRFNPGLWGGGWWVEGGISCSLYGRRALAMRGNGNDELFWHWDSRLVVASMVSVAMELWLN